MDYFLALYKIYFIVLRPASSSSSLFFPGCLIRINAIDDIQDSAQWGLWYMHRKQRPVQAQLRQIHKRVNRLPTASSGCVSSNLRTSIYYDFSWTNMFPWTSNVQFQSY